MLRDRPSSPRPPAVALRSLAPLCLAIGILLALLPPAARAQQPGSIAGVVLTAEGKALPDAQVELTSPSLPAPRDAVSGEDGSFRFADVPPGDFTVSVALQGFVSASVTGTLGSAQSLQLRPFALQIATVFSSVEVTLPPREIAQEQVRREEKQRLIGIFPNFFVSYNWKTPPLTAGQKFNLAWKNATDPGNLVLVGVVSGVQQASDAFPGYGQGAAGYGKRYGADLADLVVGTFMGGAVLPSLFHQDPRYFYKGTGTVRQRALYAVSRAVICRGDNGRNQPAFASVLGDLSAGAISNLYYPASDRHGAALTIENGFLGVAGDALNDVFQEFFLRKLTARANRKHQNNP